MVCTPLAIYILISFIYFLWYLGEASRERLPGEHKITKTDIVWTGIYLVFWAFLIGWFCNNGEEATAWMLLVLPWIIGAVLVALIFSGAFFSLSVCGHKC